MLANKINTVSLHPVNKHLSNFFYRNQMHYNYKVYKNIFKMLIQRNILPTDPYKKIKLIIYYNRFKTSNLVINNNSSPLIRVLLKTNIIYQFKYPLGDCISENNNIYLSLTSTTLLRRYTMHLSIAWHLKQTFMPNNWILENSYQKHNTIRTTKWQAKTTDSRGTSY